MTIGFFLIDDIQPEPWEAPQGSVGRTQGGKLFARLTTKQKQRMYQEALAEEFKNQYPDVEPTTDNVSLSFFFYRDLPLAETAKRKIRSHVADATNLQKAAEDALQGLLYANDRQVKHVESAIVRQEADLRPSLLVIMRPHDAAFFEWVDCTIEAIRATRETPDIKTNFRHLDDEVPF